MEWEESHFLPSFAKTQYLEKFPFAHLLTFFFFFPHPPFREAYAIGKKEKPPFLPEEPSSSSEEDDPIPDELLCLICKDIMTDAVVIPCCGNSYCDECECHCLPW